MKKTATLILMVLALYTSTQSQTLPTGPRLKDIPSTLLIGSNFQFRNSPENNPYMILWEREYNCGTALLYPFCWIGENSYKFDNGNASINWLKKQGRLASVHMLAGWNLFYNDWIKKGTWRAGQLDTMLRDWIYAAMDSNNNKEKVDVWNVVNEALAGWDGIDGAYREDSTCFLNKIGWEDDASGLTGSDKVNSKHPLFVRKAFEYARQKTNKTLELREYSIETGDNKKSKAFYQLVLHLKHSGVPVDAIGFQCHLDSRKVTDDFVAKMKTQVERYRALGLQVNFTELDIGRSGDKTWNDTIAEEQRTLFYKVISMAGEAGVNQVYTWGVADGHDTFRGTDHPLPFNNDYSPKPAYYGIQQALIDASKVRNRKVR